MLFNEELFSIEDQSLALVQSVLNSEVVTTYKKNQRALLEDQAIQKKRTAFMRKKTEFEALKSYGNYATGLKEKQLELHKMKRALDFEPVVADYKLSEMDLQTQLDTIVSKLALVLSEDIKVDTGNPFFEGKSKQHHHHHQCEGGCQHG